MNKHADSAEFKCLKCYNCKTRVFRTATQVKNWCDGRSIKPNATWINDVVDLGRIRLMWCDMRIERFNPRNASPKYSANILDINEMEKTKVVITNQDKKTFIPDCQFLSE